MKDLAAGVGDRLLAPLAPGARLSHYRIVELLGAGGMGEVWLAHDDRLDRKVALKVPGAALQRDPATRHRVMREARAAAALEHPAVCRVFELGDDGGRDFIAMEYVPGETLAVHVARGPVPVPRALEWGAAIAAALEEAHGKGIVHRDLKPANVMVTTAGGIKVMDFGLARAMLAPDHRGEDHASFAATLTAAGTILGTPAYMAPEQAKGEPADERADVWALGCVLYEMLAGKRPFAAGTAAEMTAAILEREPDLSKLPEATPRDVRLLLARCLRKDPLRRLRHAGDIRLALEEPRLEDLVHAAGGPPSAALLSRRSLLAVGGSVGLLGLGLGAGALIRASRQGRPVSYRRLTFRRGMIRTARFAPDQQTILYGALWDGEECRTYTVRPESPESRPLELPPSTPLAISASGEVALAVGPHLRGLYARGTLARVPLAGGAPRQMVEGVSFADWSPDGSELAIVREVAGKDRLEYPVGNPIFRSTGGGLSFSRISPRGDRVALFHHGLLGFGGTVVIVDRTGAVTHRSPEFLQLFGLAWRGDEVWFTAADERHTFRAIHAMDPPRAPRVVARLPGNVTLHDVSADRRLLIAHTSDRSGIAALAPGESAERNLSWLDGSSIGDLSRDGRSLLFTEFGQGGGRSYSAYLRRTDGSPAVRLGDGRAAALSPDGHRALVLAASFRSPYLDIVPTAAGESRRLEVPGFGYFAARWLPDGERIVVSAEEEGRGSRLYLQDLSGAAPRPITPSGVEPRSWAVAPDGSAVAVTIAGKPLVYLLQGGEPRPIPGLTGDDRVVAWIERGLLVDARSSGGLGTVSLVDPENGGRLPWRKIAPPDPAGIMNTGQLVVTPDGRSYAYWWHRALSDLYVVEGLA